VIELHPRLYVGDQSDCTPGFYQFAVVHACKSPCHQQAVGYREPMPHDSRYYLALETPYDLFLNLIDPPTPLFRVESFRHFREFAACHYVGSGHDLLIHCNQGQSRAPMLALLFLAKDLQTWPRPCLRPWGIGQTHPAAPPACRAAAAPRRLLVFDEGAGTPVKLS
jgi:hypothetical protein